MLVCLSKPLIVKLWHSVSTLVCICVCVCVCMCVCVCFVESVHGLNECMCYVCACVCVCVCVSQYVCCICIVQTRPMCVQVPTFKPI